MAILEAVNSGFPWRASFPDDLCLAVPHGVSCDDGANTSHDVGISLGHISDFSTNPTYAASAASAAATVLTSSLLATSFPRLRSLFVYGCFVGRPGDNDGNARPLLWRLPPMLQDLVLVNNPALSGRLAISTASLPLLRRLVIASSVLFGDLPSMAFPRLEQLVLTNSRFASRIPSTSRDDGGSADDGGGRRAPPPNLPSSPLTLLVKSGTPPSRARGRGERKRRHGGDDEYDAGQRRITPVGKIRRRGGRSRLIRWPRPPHGRRRRLGKDEEAAVAHEEGTRGLRLRLRQAAIARSAPPPP